MVLPWPMSKNMVLPNGIAFKHGNTNGIVLKHCKKASSYMVQV